MVVVWLVAAILAQHSAAQVDAGAAELKFDIRAVDLSADACTDFYAYACGGWGARHPIPPNRSYSAVFQQMRELNDKRVRDILTLAAEPRPGRSKLEQQIGDYYASCMDTAAIETKGLAPLRAELARIDAVKSPGDLADEIARLHRMGSDTLLSVSPDQRLEHASQVIAYLDQSGLNLPEVGYYTSDDAAMVEGRSGYRAHLEREFKMLGQSAPEASAAADDVLRIETALAKAALTPLQRRDRRAWYHEMTMAELQKLAPGFRWERYFAAAGVPQKGAINVAVPAYMQSINQLVKETPMPAWRNYLRWQLTRLATPVLPARFRDAEFDFYSKTLRGVKEQLPRYEQCGSLTSRDLGEAVGQVFVKRYFPPETKQRVMEMMAQIRGAMQDDIQQTSWMSATTKQEALRKLELLRVMIGYPERWRDYSRLEIRRGDAVGNAFRAQEHEFLRLTAKIGKPVEREEFYELPQGVEGYHDNPLNVVVFTAGILQPPFFDPRTDDAISYGLAGAVIGHEITHAFDDKGHQFDGAGDMRNWWTAQDSKNYAQRAACFVRQYSGYTAVGDIKVNGELTLGENIADNGGLQLAWRAFESERHQESSLIDGYTPEQRFFLGWAQWRCMNVTEKTAAILARTDGHAPGKWRVNGVVSNMPGFAAAYHCKASDAMVNREPCRVW
jgi:putative endopeptidase